MAVLLLLIFVGYSAARYLAEAVQGTLALSTAGILILLKAIIALEVLLPISLYLCVVIGLGRLYADGEMTALAACGVGTARLLRPILAFATVFALAVAALSLHARPWAYDQSYWLEARAKAEFEFSRVRPTTFYEAGEGQRVVFAQSVNRQDQRMREVFVESEHGDWVRVTFAEEARYHIDPETGERVLVLLDARIHELERTGTEDRIIKAKELTLRLQPPEVTPPGYKRKAASTPELMASDRPADMAELQWRFSTPVSTILLALLAIPLSRSAPRRGKYAKLLMAVVVYAIYYNVLGVARTWLEQGFVAAWPGIWWAHGLLGLVVVTLLWGPRLSLRRRPLPA